MKKRLLALVVSLFLLLGVVASASGSATHTNILVSRSHLEGTFFEQLKNMVMERVLEADAVITAAYLDGLRNLGQSYVDELLPNEFDGVEWRTAGSFRQQIAETNDTLVLASGAGVVWSSGTAVVSAGALIDLTAGSEISGGEMTVGHRYVAAAETTLVVTSAVAAWSVEGQWHTNATDIFEPDPDPDSGADPTPTPDPSPEPNPDPDSGSDPEPDPEPTPAPGVEPDPDPNPDPDPDPDSGAVLKFTDVPEGIWYYDAVRYVVDKGIFNGTSETTFAPQTTMNRAMLATVLHRMSGSPETAYTAVFTDVPDGTWYSAPIVWAAEIGIVKGMGNGTYQPMGNLTREQIALMLYNYANWLGLDTSGRADIAAVNDGASVSSWATEAMSWAVAVGLFQGDTNGNLNPRDPATRAAVAVLLQRFDLMGNGETA